MVISKRLVKKAFRILRRNYGCPGLDGLSIQVVKNSYESHERQLLEKLKSQKINTLPVKTVDILDYNNKPRSIFVYCIYERWLQQCLRLLLEEVVKDKISKYVFSYRRNMSMVDLEKYLKNFGREMILRLDVEKYFYNLNKIQLLNDLKDIYQIDGWLLNAIQKSIFHTPQGLPQGNVLSPSLSNLYLHPLDNSYPKYYARFSDDLFFAIDLESDVNKIQKEVSSRLKNLGLKLNTKKTEVYVRNKF